MSYTSLRFMVFVAVCFALYYVFPRKRRWWVLLAASMGFYAIVCLKYIPFIIMTSLSTYAGGLLLQEYIDISGLCIKSNKSIWSREEKAQFKTKTERVRKIITTSILILNFGILGFLKYYNFFARSISAVLNPLGGDIPQLDLFLPLGISFYTFQSMGYIIDIYRQKYVAEKNYAKILLFTSFFPQIVQGPISFYSQLAGQLYMGHTLVFENIKQGVLLVTWGFFKKLVIADRLAHTVSMIPPAFSEYSGTVILLTALFYAVQLYADFSGGIDISRGVAQLFGIDLAENFKRPYFSRTLSEYWHRWHITLGAWLREYLFYPIAMSKLFQRFGKKLKQHFGMKVSKVLPTSVASLITFIVVGVWHGAYWKYVAFGVWNGMVIMVSTLMAERFVRWKNVLHIKDTNKLFIAFQMFRTFLIVLAGYYFDIAPHFHGAVEMMYRSVTDFHISELVSPELFGVIAVSKAQLIVVGVASLLVLLVSILQECSERSLRERICNKNFVIQSAVFVVLFWLTAIFGVYGPGTDVVEFVYMQF